jgi:hypothetical protein
MSYYVPLTLCRGAACPRCGCQDSEKWADGKARGGWWNGAPDPAWLERIRMEGKGDGRPGTPEYSWRCKHCGLKFRAPEPEPPPPDPVTVPQPVAALEPAGPPLPFEQQAITVCPGDSVLLPSGLKVEFAKPAPDPAVCPVCGGVTKVTSTRKAIRWRKCVQCGKTSKTPK